MNKPLLTFGASFWLAAGLFFALGHWGAFVALFAALTLHEAAHIVTARIFGCPLRAWHISALGEAAAIPRLTQLSAAKRYTVLLAGPACNALLWAIFSHLPGSFLDTFAFYNGVLCLFNLLPIFPLDGARLAQLWAGNRWGIGRTNRALRGTGRTLLCGLLLLGLTQAVLFAPNVSLLFVAFFLWRHHHHLPAQLAAEQFAALLDKPYRLPAKPMPIRWLAAQDATPLPQLINYMGWDGYLHVQFYDKKNTPGKAFTEGEILNWVFENSV